MAGSKPRAFPKSLQLGLLKTTVFTMNSQPGWFNNIASFSNEFADWVAKNNSVYNEFAARRAGSTLQVFPMSSQLELLKTTGFTMS